MKRNYRELSGTRLFAAFPLLILMVLGAFGQPEAEIDKARLAAEVKTEFLHAWNGYKTHGAMTI
jgi:hypothetical protein